MRRYSEAVKADVRRRMSPPQRQSVVRISEELGIHVITLYKPPVSEKMSPLSFVHPVA
jgi:hypothetical protein